MMTFILIIACVFIYTIVIIGPLSYYSSGNDRSAFAIIAEVALSEYPAILFPITWHLYALGYCIYGNELMFKEYRVYDPTIQMTMKRLHRICTKNPAIVVLDHYSDMRIELEQRYEYDPKYYKVNSVPVVLTPLLVRKLSILKRNVSRMNEKEAVRNKVKNIIR